MTKGHNGLTYADAGVDIDAGNALVERIKPAAKRTDLKGVMGGLLALGMTYLAMRLLAQYLHVETAFFDRRLASLGILFGALIGFLGSAASVGRHLRRV